MTFLTPVLFIGLVIGTFLLSSIKDGETKKIVVADETNQYFEVLKNTDQYQFINAQGGFEDFRKSSDKTAYATLIISGDLLQNPSAITLYSEKQVTNNLERTISDQLNEYLSNKKIASYDIPGLKQILEESKVSIHMQTKRLSEDGKETESSAAVASIVGMIFTVIIYMFIFIYGAMVMQSVLEEKTSRIVEVMVSSVNPFELMMGKIIGIGLVGLTQFFLWVVLIVGFNILGSMFFMMSAPEVAGASAITADPGAMQQALHVLSTINITEIIANFIVYFIGGFMIYASLFAAIGAMVNSQEDTQQYITPITILVLFALYAGIYSVENPDGPLAFWTSMIPLTSPIVMMTRIPFNVPLWEKIVSVSLLFITVILLVKLSAKIYRVGILMYGKKPDLKEIIKWLKY
jgi:ABC-2 type transport system permease protein